MSQDQITTKVSNFVVRWRWPLIILNVLIVVGLFMGMAQRGQKFEAHTNYMKHILANPLDKQEGYVGEKPIFDKDYHVWFEHDNPDLVEFDEFQKIYSKEDNLMMVVRSKSGNIFTNENLVSLQTLVQEAWKIPYISRVDGLTNFAYTTVEKEELTEEEIAEGIEPADNLIVEDFISQLPLTEGELNEKKKLALGDKLMPKFLISQEGDLTQITMRAIIPSDFPDGFSQATNGARAIRDSIMSINSDLEIKLAGTVPLNNAFEEFAIRDMSTMLPIMFLVIMLILVITLRSFWGVVLPMGLLATSVIFPVFLFVGWLDFSLTNATVNVIQILVAIAIADSVHVLAVFYKQVRQGKTKEEAVRITIHKNFTACLITSLTTAIGFFSLLTQALPPFQDLGLFAGTGTLYAFYASLFTMPALLLVLPIKTNVGVNLLEEKGSSSKNSRFIESLESWISRHQVAIRWSSLSVAAIAFYLITWIEMDSNALKFFKESTEFRQATEYIDNNIIGTNPVEFNFDSGSKDGIYEPEFLAKVEKFVAYIDQNKDEFHITYTSSIVDVIKRLNKTMNGDQEEFWKLPLEDRVYAEGDIIPAKQLITQYMLLYTMSLPQGMDLNNQISLDNRYLRVTGFMTSKSSKEQIAAAGKLNEWININMPEVKARAVGVPMMFGRLMTAAIPGMMFSLIVSLILITIILGITFKSFKVALFSMIPNVWPIVMIFGVVGLSGYVVNLSVAIVGMITLGIAVDDTVHFLVKYLMARKSGLDKDASINQTFHQVGGPLFFTSIILVAGFGVLMLSEFALNSDLGMFCSAVIALALYADFIVLPAFLLKFDHGQLGRSKE